MGVAPALANREPSAMLGRMHRHAPSLDWIDSQRDRMIRLVSEWASINSGTYNVRGIERLSGQLQAQFAVLGGEMNCIDLPPQEVIDPRGNAQTLPLARAISIQKHPTAALRVFLGIHMDTVYGPDDPFQKVERIDEKTLRGPGVVDAKGGLAVMLIALEALERGQWAGRIGWEVLVNPDEEIGSPGSAGLLAQCAGRNHLGLVFEPALADGAMVWRRKGSGNFSVVFHGRAAHAGRDFESGRNAIVAAGDYAVAASRLSGLRPGVTVNVGRIDGGGPANVVPDLAVLRLNARIEQPPDAQAVQEQFNQIAREIADRHDVSAVVHGSFLSPPKMLDEPTRRLCDQVKKCGLELGIPIHWRSSGGVSDGNKLAAAGLPVIDTFGPRGGNLHSRDEYLALDSLTERARLGTLFLLKLASGEIPWASAGATS